MAALSPCDPCSFSRPDLCAVVHADLDISVNFDKKVISGTVHITVEKKQAGVETIILDTRDVTVTQVSDKDSGQELTYSLGEPTGTFGSKLEIKLPNGNGKKYTLSIKYATSPKCSALQWLRPEQTAGKRQPYLFSQCEAIHARSLFPCQDSPAVKFPYSAKVTAPREVTVLMSAVRLGSDPCAGDSASLETRFLQEIPIPSYLLAIVAGDIESRKIGPRSKVWSEKEFVDEAAYEFAETEEMLVAAESLMGPYVWSQYDLLVLPPSFPFGGMENPCLTFVTPTLLAGDRSLANVVAHEIAHSWTGNLVTNKTFEHFWLNEGFTKYLERLIVCKLNQTPGYRQFLANEGLVVLQNAVETLKNGPYTRLVVDLKGVDPDDAFSTVPYEKGFTLLFYLETLLGGPGVFEKFLRSYIEKFTKESIDTQQWKEYLYSYFSDEKSQTALNTVDWDTWFNGQGMPPVIPDYDTSLASACTTLREKWCTASDSDLSQFNADDLTPLSSMQRREFLSQLLQQPPLSVTKLQKMQEVYDFNSVRNSEIRFRWLRLGLLSHWADAIPRAIQFVTEQGRMKFVRPLYRDMYAWEEARQPAIDNFLAVKDEMHNTTAGLIEKELHLK
ncbi:leukotriene A-4 hydrolase-like isoform X2 [Haliotis rufescens]|uniref:leukotriene A-4 hydrolase-like isoform X2 n=1 Tax=Haliotis rufescens TaxID=6454 RepID=UPI00201E9535|nr:leukotriene A-4 hydrolase-like isoform X2 [Haliotis rufescens]